MAFTSQIHYQGHLRNEAQHLASQTIIHTDAPLDNHGRGEAFSPTDLVATALGACLMTIMGIVADRHEIDLSDTRLDVQKIMSAQPPRRIAEVVVHIHFPAKTATLTTAQRTMLEHAARTCPVALSLHPDLVQTFHFYWP